MHLAACEAAHISLEDEIGMAQPAGPAHPRGYPYGTGRLAPDWGNRRAQALALAAIVAAVLAAVKRSPLALAAADELALGLVFPALLAIVLAFARVRQRAWARLRKTSPSSP